MDNNDLIDRTLDALDRLMKMFAFERILYLACAVISFALLLFCLFSLVSKGSIEITHLTLIFGAAGLIAASAARVSYFLNKSFELVTNIITQLAAKSNSDD